MFERFKNTVKFREPLYYELNLASDLPNYPHFEGHLQQMEILLTGGILKDLGLGRESSLYSNT